MADDAIILDGFSDPEVPCPNLFDGDRKRWLPKSQPCLRIISHRIGCTGQRGQRLRFVLARLSKLKHVIEYELTIIGRTKESAARRINDVVAATGAAQNERHAPRRTLYPRRHPIPPIRRRRVAQLSAIGALLNQAVIAVIGVIVGAVRAFRADLLRLVLLQRIHDQQPATVLERIERCRLSIRTRGATGCLLPCKRGN